MTMRRAFPLLCIAVLAGVAACQQAAPLSAADQAALRATADSFTARVRRADWPGAAASYATDAHFMPPNETARVGRDAILNWMKAFPPINSFELKVEDVGGVGDMAYIRGTYSMTFTPPGARAPVADAGKFLEVRRRQADGAWLNVADIFNSDKPAPH